MSRRFRPRKTKPTFAFVVDGETEIWYLQMLKRNERNLRVTIKPEIPQKKKLEDQYKLVCDLAGSEYLCVFWLLDLDTLIKESRETASGTKTSLSVFNEMRSKICSEFQNVRIIVNNPCLEFWFLLHFEPTSRYYRRCSDVVRILKKYLPGYEKTQPFFKKANRDIYWKLKPYLNNAIDNATALEPFDFRNPERAICEMYELFHHEEFTPCLRD